MSNLSPEQFAVGEVAIFCRPGSPYFGTEVTVISALKRYRTTDTRDGTVRTECVYEISGPFGPTPSHHKGWGANPEYLRKKRPPRKDLQIVRWADCPWQPESLHV